MRKWILSHIHPYDDYTVRACPHNDIRDSIHTLHTVWLHVAIMQYIRFNIKYRDCTVMITHHRYER